MHIPVLRQEVISALNVQSNGSYLDATLGCAGHSSAILERLSEGGKIYAIDRDPERIEVARECYADDCRIEIIQGLFADMYSLLKGVGFTGQLDGVLMDIGVASPHLDQSSRGFSFLHEGPLDMRMDKSTGRPLVEWLEDIPEKELVRVIFRFSEEKYAPQIARAIIRARTTQTINTTTELASIIERALPPRERNQRRHPATKTFQALRIAINDELQQLEDALPQAVRLLKQGGRLVVISFHSLEDRIVKRFMRHLAVPKLPPKFIPVDDSCYQTPLRLLGKAVRASQREVSLNPRARSAVMRVAERTRVEYA